MTFCVGKGTSSDLPWLGVSTEEKHRGPPRGDRDRLKPTLTGGSTPFAGGPSRSAIRSQSPPGGLTLRGRESPHPRPKNRSGPASIPRRPGDREAPAELGGTAAAQVRIALLPRPDVDRSRT